MNITEIGTAVQNGVISVSFLVLVIASVLKGPGLFRDWLANKERLEQMRYEELETLRMWQTAKDKDDADRRHDLANMFQKSLAEMHADGKDNLRIVAESVCRYRQ